MIVLCPGGDAVYVYTLGSILPAIITTAIWTVTILMFGMNLTEYLKSKDVSKRVVVLSFVFVIVTAIVNILTFVFFVHKERVIIHGTTTSSMYAHDISIIGIIIVLAAIVGTYVLLRYHEVI